MKHWELSPCGTYIGQWDKEGNVHELVAIGNGIATTKDMYVLAASQILLEACKLAAGAFAVMPETPESREAMREIKLALEHAAGKHWSH
jgi:hypothetical protein